MDYANEPKGVFFLIDNKSFYASVEATMRGLNPLHTLMVVMSEQENTNGGLILATSPLAKKYYHLQANVSRQRDLPQDEHLMVVPPRMNLYIQRNLQINDIFRRFVADEDLLPYSIDESILDLTHSWRLFGDSPREVAVRIQKTVRKELGLYTTIGIGDNPVQAKLALDLYAKHTDDLIGEIHYDTVPEKIWTVDDLTEVWGIGNHMAKRLNRLGIHTMDELAHANPYLIKEKLGEIGAQLFATAWGIDRTVLHQTYKVKSSSLGNSQVLPRDYHNQAEIETVIKEIGEQVASRLRHHHVLASKFLLSIGFAYASSENGGSSGFSVGIRIDPTADDILVATALIRAFRKHWHHEVIRNVAVFSGNFSDDSAYQLDLFTPLSTQEKRLRTEHALDLIHARFGFTALVYARSLTEGGTAMNRASLVGGHNGGNAYE